MIEHCLSMANFPDKCLIGKQFNKENDMNKLYEALLKGETVIEQLSNQICKVKKDLYDK